MGKSLGQGVPVKKPKRPPHPPEAIEETILDVLRDAYDIQRWTPEDTRGYLTERQLLMEVGCRLDPEARLRPVWISFGPLKKGLERLESKIERWDPKDDNGDVTVHNVRLRRERVPTGEESLSESDVEIILREQAEYDRQKAGTVRDVLAPEEG